MSKILAAIESHNKKVEELMKKRTVAEAQREVLQNNIKGKLEEYKEMCGVDLYNPNMNECTKAVLAEYEKVMNQIKAEYEKSSEVVSLIEAGRVAEARKILGVDAQPEEVQNSVPEKKAVVQENNGNVVTGENTMHKMNMGDSKASVEKSEEKVVEKEVSENKTPVSISPEELRAAMASQEEPRRVREEELESEEEEFESEDDDFMIKYDEQAVKEDSEDDDFGFDFEEDDEQEEQTVKKPVDTTPTQEFEDDDDDFGFDFGTPKKESGLTSVAEAVKEVEAASSKQETPKAAPKMPTGMGFSFDDEEDMGFNFKNLLKGSKFEV